MKQTVKFLLPPKGNHPQCEASEMRRHHDRLISIEQLRSAFAASNAAHFPIKKDEWT